MSHNEPPPPTQVKPYLWLCDFYNFYDQTFLPASGINAVLSLLDDPAPLWKRPEFTDYITSARHLYVKCSDTADQDFLSEFQMLCEWIENMRKSFEGKDGVVLVHCEEGVSRSPCVVVAYLIWKDEVGIRKGVDMVKGKRGVVDIREEFLEQLRIWERQCRDQKEA